MANRWETVETVTDSLFLGSKITVDSDCNHEFKRWLLLGRKPVTNLDSILKTRDITLLTKVHLVKTTVFPGVMYGCDSWTIRKAERQRTDAFELCCWRRLLRVPWTARSNQSTLKKISPEYSLEGLMMKLKFQYFGQLMEELTHWEKENPHAGKDWRQEKKGTTEDEIVGWHPWLNLYEFQQTPGDGERQGSLVCCSPRAAKCWTRLSDWATTVYVHKQ